MADSTQPVREKLRAVERFGRRYFASVCRRLTPRAQRIVALHDDERGAISILTVATIIGLMMLMGMVLNVARHFDDKVKMQNAADASAYSGGVVLARGMNALAFSNHLLSEVFALTAFMRESRDRNAESLTSEILDAWARIGPIFQRSEFSKFSKLGTAITAKVPLERDAVRTYGEMSALTSQFVLPVFEYVLQERLIPEFQRSVVRTLPNVAQQATTEVARRHGIKQPKRPEVGILWRTMGQAVGFPDENDPNFRTLPAVDPSPGSGAGQNDPKPDPRPDGLEGADFRTVQGGPEYLRRAIAERRRLSRNYLEQWIADRLVFFSYEGKMSQYINLFRTFACGQLDRLLNEEYPTTNLPHMMRFAPGGLTAQELFRNGDLIAVRPYLDRDFTFLGIAYRAKLTETFAGFFRNPLASDPQAFTQVHLFVPEPRWRYSSGGVSGGGGGSSTIGGGGFGLDFPPIQLSALQGGGGVSQPGWFRDGWPTHWDLFNQNWTVQIAPATTESLAMLLQTQPPQNLLNTPNGTVRIKVPNLGTNGSQRLRNVNSH